MMKKFEFTPVGYVRSGERYKFEAPRQGVFSGSSGKIELLPQYGGAAVADLSGFERIWVIFCFHLNCDSEWKPMVRPPVSPDGGKYSIFATRAPYRPNPVGISCVKLLKVTPQALFIENIDMLDGTPVLDIKPYIPEADAFPGSAAGWRDKVIAAEKWELHFSELFRTKAEFLQRHGAPDMINFAQLQLACSPFDSKRKRIYPPPDESGCWELGCRTWRIRFIPDQEKHRLTVADIRSNYTPAELAPQAADPYSDKKLHRLFLNSF